MIDGVRCESHFTVKWDTLGQSRYPWIYINVSDGINGIGILVAGSKICLIPLAVPGRILQPIPNHWRFHTIATRNPQQVAAGGSFAKTRSLDIAWVRGGRLTRVIRQEKHMEKHDGTMNIFGLPQVVR